MKYKPANRSQIKSGMTSNSCHSCVGRNLWMPHQVRHDIKLGVLLVGLLTIASAANIAYVAKDAPGDTATAGAGKQWPTTRFEADASGNCITDKLTGLMWAKNANLFGQKKWKNTDVTPNTYPAQEAINAMNGSDSSATGYHLCGYNDWRLPAQTELLSLFNYKAATGSNQATWLNNPTQGFTNVQANSYWSSTPGGNGAWYVGMGFGISSSAGVSNGYYVWPVRGGR